MLTKFMEKDLIELNKVMEGTKWIICPECGEKLRHEAGCVQCVCGWSKCM